MGSRHSNTWVKGGILGFPSTLHIPPHAPLPRGILLQKEKEHRRRKESLLAWREPCSGPPHLPAIPHSSPPFQVRAQSV